MKNDNTKIIYTSKNMYLNIIAKHLWPSNRPHVRIKEVGELSHLTPAV